MTSQPSSKMSGISTFNTFSYLLNGTQSLSTTAKETIDGSNYCRVSAALFSAFTIEAHLNHIGEAKIPFWRIIEPKLSWRNKLELITGYLKVDGDFGKRPFQSLIDLFKFRDQLAHGKTINTDTDYLYHENRQYFDANPYPKWLTKFWSDESVERVIFDIYQIVKLLHQAAGFEDYSLNCVNHAEFTELPLNSPTE